MPPYITHADQVKWANSFIAWSLYTCGVTELWGFPGKPIHAADLQILTFLSVVLQIKSVDYTFADGQQVQSTRLPGYSGVAGLDGDQEAEDRKREADLEAGIGEKPKRSPARRRDTAEEFNTIYEVSTVAKVGKTSLDDCT